MHERLIGQEATIELPCNSHASSLLMGFLEELLGVGGSNADDPQRLREELEAAIESLCGGSGERLEAHLLITADGVDMHLSCGASGIADRRLTVREA